jgi:aryl-alcohol dehydrogenase-like predicted oxidoreductase
MASVELGTTGLRTSAIGFGAWNLSGDYGPADDLQSVDTLRRALELGVTLVDTADEYGGGHNERLVGKAIAGRRDDVVLATKAGLVPDGAGRHSVCGRPDHLRGALEASLRRLGVEAVDLFYLHRIDPTVPVEDSVGAMAELVQAGKARFIGLCEASPDAIRRAHRVQSIAVVQSEYSLFTRDPEAAVLPLVRRLGIGFVAFSPLGRGLLTGGFHAGTTLDPTDFRHALPRFQSENLGRNAARADMLARAAVALGVTPTQLALAWLVRQHVVPIPGTRSREHLEENVVAAGVELGADDLARLDETFPPGIAWGERYPGSMSALASRPPDGEEHRSG